MNKLLAGACLLLSPVTAQAAPNVGAKPPTLDPTYGLAKPKMTPPKAGAPVASWIWAAQSGGKQTVFAPAHATTT